MTAFDEGGALDNGFFDMLAWNLDRNGLPFASVMEAKDVPFFATQFHPEKNAFEWDQSWESFNQSYAAHSTAAIEATEYLARFFVQQTRMNVGHIWPEEASDFPLIYAFEPIPQENGDFEWESAYFW